MDQAGLDDTFHIGAIGEDVIPGRDPKQHKINEKFRVRNLRDNLEGTCRIDATDLLTEGACFAAIGY